MTNFEYYKDFFLEALKEGGRCNIGLVKGEPKQCNDIDCDQCDFHGPNCTAELKDWFKEEYEEQTVDWSKVPVDTKIWVRDYTKETWLPMHFAKYDEKINKVFAWLGGGSSWTEDCVVCWKFVKLAEEVEE